MKVVVVDGRREELCRYLDFQSTAKDFVILKEKTIFKYLDENEGVV